MSAMRVSPAFDRLLDETRSLLQSPDFSIVLESCLDRATDILFKSIKDTIFVQDGSSVDETGAPLQLRLAGLLPGIARWSHLAFNGLPNELVDVRTLEPFLYSCAYISFVTAPGRHPRGRSVLCHHLLWVRKPIRVTGVHAEFHSFISPIFNATSARLSSPIFCRLLDPFVSSFYCSGSTKGLGGQ